MRVLRRRPRTGSAWLNGHRIARSDDVVIVEGAAYFPLSDVDDGALSRTWFKSLCYWKGVASYFDVSAGGVVASKSAWTYQHPSPLARVVKGRVAFWYDVEVRLD